MNLSVSFFIPVQEDIRAVEDLIRAQADGRHPDLGAALDLLLSAGGKRIRPTLTLLVGKMLGADFLRLITLSAAIELLHTATLVHDDLIDGSLLRRGMPTLNSHWSPGATVLTGDYLFASAAKLASETNSLPVMHLFSRTLTVIVNGEITQLFTSRCQINREEYQKRIYAKTASLFETSAATAAMISDAEPATVEALRRFGYEIGMAFQIIDDILDFTGEQETLGKPVGSDLRQGLVTLPTIYYAEQHPEDREVQDLIAGNCISSELQINRLIGSIQKSTAIKEARHEAFQYVERGLNSVRKLPANPERQSLEDLANYIVAREV
ncbi:MAG TPA: polyprenyl synthetase family protein [Anaerolineaceae bacterium]|nr:polyprenyl synthetase family protein [Anaerolineaceae bacterium]